MALIHRQTSTAVQKFWQKAQAVVMSCYSYHVAADQTTQTNKSEPKKEERENKRIGKDCNVQNIPIPRNCCVISFPRDFLWNWDMRSSSPCCSKYISYSSGVHKDNMSLVTFSENHRRPNLCLYQPQNMYLGTALPCTAQVDNIFGPSSQV